MKKCARWKCTHYTINHVARVKNCMLKIWNEKCHFNDEWYRQSVIDDPRGKICSFCGNKNDMFDDLGWFYFPTPMCRTCWAGNLGKNWKLVHGTGDR